MSDEDGKCGGRKCPLGFDSGSHHGLGSGHGECPYGFGSGCHDHGHGYGGSAGHCPYLRGLGGQWFTGHGASQHHGSTSSPMLQCPWMVARMHACPWAWGVGSAHHGGRHTPCCKRKDSCDFCVTLKVVEYCSEELEVKVVGQEVIVHGKHDARPDKPGDPSTVSREFTRRYQLADDIDPQTVASCLSDDHELNITATKKVAEGEPRVVTIQVTGASGDQ